MSKKKQKSLDELVFEDDYYCGECGTQMNLIGDVLICPKCGHAVDVDDYLTEYEEEEGYFPTLEEVEGDSEEESGETYDEVYDELHRG